MSGPVDLDARLSGAVTEAPDTERALGTVMRRVRRRRLWKGMSAITACAVIAVSAVWILDRGASTEPTVHSEPPTTTTAVPDIHLRSTWSADRPVTFGGFPSTLGQLIDTDERSVYVASGLTDPGQISALDRLTGDAQWTASLPGPGGAWIQGVADGVLIANNYDQLMGFDTITGETRWTVSLASLGLGGYYRPATSAVVGGISAIGAAASQEGDERPPVVLGVRTGTGEVVWQTALTEGTSFNWGVPPVSDGATIFLTTPDAVIGPIGNQAHMLRLADGVVQWVADLGGSQGFSRRSPVGFGASVVLPAPGEVRAFDRASGTHEWSAPGVLVMSAADGLWTLRPDGSLALLDPETGDALRVTPEPVIAPGLAQLLDLGSGLVGLATVNELKVLDAEGRVLLTQALGGLIDEIAQVGDTLYVASFDNKVTAYQLERVAKRAPDPAPAAIARGVASPEDCVSSGPETVVVPSVVGQPLGTAIETVQAIGLTVVGYARPPVVDPADAGVLVRVQAPSPGVRVPKGACIAFRTG